MVIESIAITFWKIFLKTTRQLLIHHTSAFNTPHARDLICGIFLFFLDKFKRVQRYNEAVCIHHSVSSIFNS